VRCSVLQCVAVCCSVLQRNFLVSIRGLCILLDEEEKAFSSGVLCCGVLQCVALYCNALQCAAFHCVLHCVEACCSALQCVASHCSAWQRVAVQYPCVARCCSVYVSCSMCCSVLQRSCKLLNNLRMLPDQEEKTSGVVCRSTLRRVAVCCSVLQRSFHVSLHDLCILMDQEENAFRCSVAVCCSVLQCGAVCFGVLQCVGCSILQFSFLMSLVNLCVLLWSVYG